MTNEELLEYRKREKRLSDRERTIVFDLKTFAPASPITRDAAEIIEWLQQRIARLKSDLHEEAKEADRSARDAYTQGRQDEASDRDRGTT